MTQAPPRRRRRGPAPRPVDHPRLAPGAQLFDRYLLERSLGRGGSAEVWQAHDERLDRTVAIKILHPHLLPDAASIDRFVAEARTAAGLTHPAVVPVFDVIEDPRTPAIVLRFVDGETLAERIARRGPMGAAEAAAVAADLAGALAHAHHVGLVHRDVKPGNVLVDADGRAQLVDFGIARALDGTGEGDTAPGDVVGTLRYMAPEQLAGRPVDGRTDLYALGLVLYELLTGHPAYASTTPAALLTAQREGPPTLPAATPEALARLLGELLALDPADRPPDADDVEARLRAFVESPSPEAAPATSHSAGARDDALPDRGTEAETVAFAAPPTVAIAVPAPVAGARPPGPPAASRPLRRARRPGPLAIGGAAAAIGAAALALAIVGVGHDPAAVTRAADPTGNGQLGPTPTVRATAATKAVKVPPGRGHGKHGGN